MASHVPFLAVRPDEQYSLDIKTRDFGAKGTSAPSSPKRRKPAATAAMDNLADKVDRTQLFSTVTSRVPKALRFPAVCIVSLGVSSILYTLASGIFGHELAAVSRDLTEGWHIGIILAWRLTELGVAWYARYDYLDLAYMSLLTNVPHYFLLHTFYGIDYLASAIPLVIDVASITLPFALFPQRGTTRASTVAKGPHQAVLQDKNVNLLTTLFGASVFAIVVYSSFSTWLPTHLIVHFDGLRTLDKAHNSAVLALLVLFVPMGYAASEFLFVPALSAGTSHVSADAVVHRHHKKHFHPETATLGETVAWNLGLSDEGLSRRAKVLARRTTVLVACTFINTFVRVFWTIDGTELVGALGWAGTWSLADVLVGVAYSWVGQE